MSASCCNNACQSQAPVSPRYRRILWIALLVNAAMFLVEVAGGLRADSVSLLADSLDFLGDAANYGISLWVLGMSLTVRARASLIKAGTMAAFGIGVLLFGVPVLGSLTLLGLLTTLFITTNL